MTPPMIPKDVEAALARLRDVFASGLQSLSSFALRAERLDDLDIVAAAMEARRTDLLNARGDLVVWHEWWAALPAGVRAAHPMPVRTPHPAAKEEMRDA